MTFNVLCDHLISGSYQTGTDYTILFSSNDVNETLFDLSIDPVKTSFEIWLCTVQLQKIGTLKIIDLS